MPDGVYKTEELSLWECLHDGDIKQVRSDLMARTLTIVVDTPFHWGFHKLPADTRFEIVGENVSIAEAFDFEPWPGAWVPVQGTPWEEAEERRRSDYVKGRLISADWKYFISQIETGEDYQIINAEVDASPARALLNLGILSSRNSEWREVKIHANHFRFFIGSRELSLQDFQEFGSKYWTDWASKSKTQEQPPESGEKEPGSE